MTKVAESKGSIAQDLSALLESFSEKDPGGKQAMKQLLASDARNFGTAGIRLLPKCIPSPGSRYLVHLLIKEKLLPSGLLDPRSITLEEASATLRSVTEHGTSLQPMLELALNRALLEQPSPETTERILRLLELLAAIIAPISWNAFQLELMAHPDRFVRSKATLLIGRSTKNVAWIGRRFLDNDARVQASAVEALWVVDEAESHPLLLTASKSKHNRVAANAALGLYRLADLKAITIMLDLARRPDPLFRISAYWAIGESQDPRFFSFLMEQFKTSQGRERLAVTRALGCIRRREKTLAQVDPLDIRVAYAHAGKEGERSIAFSLGSSRALDFTAMKATDFAVWENGALVEDFEIRLPNIAQVLAAGFVAPQFPSASDPYAQAVSAALNRSSALKRPDDVWRIDRYSIHTDQPGSETVREKTGLPYDEALMSPELKMRYSFIASPELLSKVVSAEVPSDRVAPDSFRALERQSAAIGKLTGKRHMFVFLHHDSNYALEDEARMRSLKELVAADRIVLHGFSPATDHLSTDFRGLCLSIPEGTFSNASLDELPTAVEEIYSVLTNACVITYRLAAGDDAGRVSLKVWSNLGAGQAEITLQSDAGS